MTIESALIVLGIGVFTGFINILAAGGSLITLPMLIFFGLPSSVANGTNRIAVFVQNISAMYVFYKKGMLEWKFSLKVALPAVAGSLVGSSYAVSLSDEAFEMILAIVIIAVLVLTLMKSPQPAKTMNTKLTASRMVLLMLAFFAIGFYGGFIQAGVGFLIIAALTFLVRDMSLASMHSVKTITITIYLFFSTFIFIFTGQIHWGFALVLAAGTMVGGWLGGKFSVSIPERWLKWAMLIITGALALYLLIW